MHLSSVQVLRPCCWLRVAAKRAQEAAQSAPTQAAGSVDAVALQARAAAMFQALPAEMSAESYPVTDARVALGRTLYYDPRLSRNQDISCNSCHDLAKYGVDGAPTSSGDKGQLGGRNSPTTYNAALHIAQFWDGRAADVEAQAKGPILNPVEMAMPDADAVVKVLRSIPGYAELFKAAFPDDADPLNYDNVGLAIGAFERAARDAFTLRQLHRRRRECSQRGTAGRLRYLCEQRLHCLSQRRRRGRRDVPEAGSGKAL